MSSTRTAVLLSLLACLWPARASADWYLMPFIGVTFGGETNFVDLEQAAGATKRVYGGSVGVLGAGVVGLEIDFGYSPGFFEREDGSRLIVASRVTTLMGNVIIAAPLRWTRESLRPYFVAGLGLMRPRIDDVLDVFEVKSNLLGLDLGGGVIGFFTERTGVRFDLRHFRNLSEEDAGGGLGFGATHLSFWRASAGVVLRR